MSEQTPKYGATAIVTPANETSNEAIITSIITNGDLSKLSAAQKVAYYKNFCERLGLDSLSQPFKLLRLNGKEILYCDRTGAQQLNKLHHVSHEIRAREIVNGCYVVTSQASTPDGRHTESIGAVPIENLRGDNLCNAMMKAETKAKRRATLDLLGLGILDETETETIPNTTPTSTPVPETASGRGGSKPPTSTTTAPAISSPNPTPTPRYEPEAVSDDPMKRRYPSPEALEQALGKAFSVSQLADLYYVNIETIEKNAALKALFSARKVQINNGSLQQQAAEPEHTVATALEALTNCKSVSDLKDLKNLLPSAVVSDPAFDSAAADKYEELEGLPF